MIQNDHELEVARQRITAFQDALLALRRNQLPTNYTQIARNFLFEIQKMEAEVHAYLQRCPMPKKPAIKIPLRPQFSPRRFGGFLNNHRREAARTF